MIFLGLLVGTIGTLIGAGGGFILVPVLMWLRPEKSAAEITAVSLAVVFFNALSGTITYALKRKVDFRNGSLFALVSIPGAIFGALLVGVVPRAVFDPIFAGMLCVIAVAIWLRPNATRSESVPLTGRLRAIGAFSSVGVGFLSSLLGIGGGIIHMPLLVLVLRYSLASAVATSHFILCVTSFAGSIVHVGDGTLDWALVGWIAPGVVIGAQVGAFLSSRVPARVIAKGASAALIAVAARIALR